MLEVATRHAAEVSLLRDQVERQQAELERLRSDVAASLRHVAVVRFDAFGDMGGRLSFSAALLDDAGDGLVLTVDPRPRGDPHLRQGADRWRRASTRCRPRRSRPCAPPSARAGSAMSTRYGFLGPAGTFTEAALRQVLPGGRGQPSRCRASTQPSPRVRSGDLDAAVVPIENSVEGGVSATLDALASGAALRVTREMLVPITFVLAARPGTALADVRRVASHPHGWAQCRGWVGATLPEAMYVPALSTAAAAEGLDVARDDAPPYDAALCAPLAARTVRARGAGRQTSADNAAAVTRFVLVQRPGEVPAPTGADKTTLVVYQADDHPGGLLEMLEQFATRGINLSRIESRPTGELLGRYCFSIDCEGHVADARVGEAVMGLHRTCREVRWLGSYPRADAQDVQVTAATTDTAFTRAGDWLARLRTGQA